MKRMPCLPRELIILIVAYNPDWHLSEPVALKQQDGSLNLKQILNGKMIQQHIDDAMMQYWNKRVQAMELLPSGVMLRCALKVKWSRKYHYSLRPIDAIGFSSDFVCSIPIKGYESGLIFLVKWHFCFQTQHQGDVECVMPLQERTHIGNVVITCVDYFTLYHINAFAIGAGKNLVEIGVRLECKNGEWHCTW